MATVCRILLLPFQARSFTLPFTTTSKACPLNGGVGATKGGKSVCAECERAPNPRRPPCHQLRRARLGHPAERLLLDGSGQGVRPCARGSAEPWLTVLQDHLAASPWQSLSGVGGRLRRQPPEHRRRPWVQRTSSTRLMDGCVGNRRFLPGEARGRVGAEGHLEQVADGQIGLLADALLLLNWSQPAPSSAVWPQQRNRPRPHQPDDKQPDHPAELPPKRNMRHVRVLLLVRPAGTLPIEGSAGNSQTARGWAGTVPGATDRGAAAQQRASARAVISPARRSRLYS